MEECNLSKFIPIKKKKVKGYKYSDKYELWEFSESLPNKDYIKHFFGKTLAIASKQLMDNHVYRFGDDIRVQTDKGSIGVEFTGVAAEIKMLKWCLILKETLDKYNIKNDIQSRLVNDITLLPSAVRPGMRIVGEELVYVKEKEKEDSEIDDDLRTMKLIQNIANDIDKNIQVSFDVESLNDDNMVPILDVKAKFNNESKKIEYKFYRKPMVNRRESALSIKSKITILTQECF